MSAVIDILHELSDAGRELLAVSEVEDTAAKLAIVQRLGVEECHLAEARSLGSHTRGSVWTALQAEKVVLADVARAFASVMALGTEGQALHAAVVYTHLLNSEGCPVSCWRAFRRGGKGSKFTRFT